MRIWKTIKAGALAAMLACTATGCVANTIPKTPSKTPAARKEGCVKLETIAKKEAAGIPQDLAKASHDLSKKLKPRVQYQCTVVNKTGGRFNPAKSYDKYSVSNPRGKGLKPYSKDIDFGWTWNRVSENNISRGYPPLVDDSINYVTQFNLLYSEKKHHLKTNFAKTFDPKKIRTYRYINRKHKVPKSLRGYELQKLSVVGYRFSKLPRGVKRKTDHFGAQLLPLYPELVIPYKALKPDFVKLHSDSQSHSPNLSDDDKRNKAALRRMALLYGADYDARVKAALTRISPKDKERKTKKRKGNKKKKNIGMTAGLGVLALSHPIVGMAGGFSLQTGYHFRTKQNQQIRPDLGIYGTFIFAQLDNIGSTQQCFQVNCSIETSRKIDIADLISGSVGTYLGLRLHNYFSLRMNLGFAMEQLKIEWTSLENVKNYKYLGVESGVGLCTSNGVEKGAVNKPGVRFCLSYQMRYMNHPKDIETRLERKVRPDSHGGLFTVEFMF